MHADDEIIFHPVILSHRQAARNCGVADVILSDLVGVGDDARIGNRDPLKRKIVKNIAEILIFLAGETKRVRCFLRYARNAAGIEQHMHVLAVDAGRHQDDIGIGYRLHIDRCKLRETTIIR